MLTVQVNKSVHTEPKLHSLRAPAYLYSRTTRMPLEQLEHALCDYYTFAPFVISCS